MKLENCEVIIASSSSDDRDGIGIEAWYDNKLLIEIFRDDSKKVNLISCYRTDIPLEFIERCIERFKTEIPKLNTNT